MRCQGLTLPELIFTLAIAAILMTVAVPSFSDWIDRTRLRTAAYDLLTDIQMARNEAVNRGIRVGLTNGDNKWSTGWEIFVDEDADGERDSGEPVLFDRSALPTSITVSANSPLDKMISYVPSGQSRKVDGGFQAGTLTLCAEDIDKAYQIVISPGGRPRMVSDADSAAVCN